MATGPADTVTVELQLGGAWVDVSASVSMDSQDGVTVRPACRASEFDDIQPGSCSFVLLNRDGRWTPDNPTSPYYPNLTEGAGVRVTVTKGAVVSRRFLGQITALEPSWPEGNVAGGQVAVTAADALAQASGRTLRSNLTEAVDYLANQAVAYPVLRAPIVTTSWSGASGHSITIPAGTFASDLMVLIVSSQQASNITITSGGWTIAANGWIGVSGQIATKVATAGDTPGTAVTWTSASTTGFAALAVIKRGTYDPSQVPPLTSPRHVDVQALNGTGGSSTLMATAPAHTMVLHAAMVIGSGLTLTHSRGATEIAGGDTGTATWLLAQDLYDSPGAGPNEWCSWSWDGVNRNYALLSVEIVGPTPGLSGWDYWPCDDGDGATVLRNANRDGSPLQIVQHITGQGQLSLGQADGMVTLTRGSWPIQLDGMLTFETGPDGYGPAVMASVMPSTQLQTGLWLRTTQDLGAAGNFSTIAIAYDAGGNVVFRLRLVSYGTFHEIDAVSPNYTTVMRALGSVNDGRWHSLTAFPDGTGGFFWFGDGWGFGATASSDIDPSQIATIVYGGSLIPKAPGKQDHCYRGDLAGMHWMSNQQRIGGVEAYGELYVDAATDRWTDLGSWGSTYWPGGVTADPALTSATQVARRDYTGTSLTDALADVARTVGGVWRADYTSQTLTLTAAASLRSPTPAVTIDLAGDADGAPTRRRAVDSRPTRVTVTSPMGTGLAVDDAAEAAGRRLDEQVDSCSPSVTAATILAGARLNRSVALRITQLAVDLAGAVNDLWAPLMALQVGDRIRLTSHPAVDGATQVDVYAAGWTERYAEASAVWTLDTTPADAPSDGLWDDTDRGRFGEDPGSMTVTGGTALGNTGTGTIVVTTLAGHPVLSPLAGDYPLTLDWSGEAVTVTSAPGSSTSPQTLTVTGRGAAGTVARSHATGEAIGVWHTAAWTL